MIKNIAETIPYQVNIDELLKIANTAPGLQSINARQFLVPHAESQIKIAVAKDEAFNFYYSESLRILEQFGVDIIHFSPLYDEKVPQADGLIIGGGFPEMFAAQLETNISMRESIKNAINSGMPTFAECGGYMYLMNELIDFEDKTYKMIGSIDNSAKMNNRLQMVGYVEAELLNDCILGKNGDAFHAHEFHFSNELSENRKNAFNCVKIRNNEKYFAGFVSDNIIASYLHIHFAGCINAAKNFIESCKNYHRRMQHE